MDESLLTQVTQELDRTLSGRRLHRMAQRGTSEVLIDFRRRDGLWLRVSTDPANLSLHLSPRPDRDSGPPQRTDVGFIALAKKYLENARLVEIDKVSGDRIVHMKFERDDVPTPVTLIVMLTGRSADAIIVENGKQVTSLRNRPHDLSRLSAPTPISRRLSLDESVDTSLPANVAATTRFDVIEEQLRFSREQTTLRTRIEKNLRKSLTLKSNLEADRERFHRSDSHQRYGELLLGNLHQIRTAGDSFLVTDFYDPESRETLIPMADKADPREAAEHYFKLARRARNGIKAIDERLARLAGEIADIQRQLQSVNAAQNLADLQATRAGGQEVRSLSKPAAPGKAVSREKSARIPGIRRYSTMEGYEILVGRSDKDNDNLTFHIAKSHDLWFHAADYPGSHVVLRNPGRKPVPQAAIQKAAQIAAKFSGAKNDSRVAVNYCERKFVSKLRKAPVGQVRLSAFKTMLVEPGEPAERIY